MTKKNEKNEGKEVAVKEENGLALTGMFDTSLKSASDNMEAKDLVIAKIHLAQPLTPEVLEKKIDGGSYMNSVTKKPMGDKVEVFVMSDTKLWQYYFMPKGKTKKDYLGTTEYFGNENARKEPKIPTELLKRAEHLGVKEDMLLPPDEVFRFYTVKVEDVLKGCAFPYIIDCKRSSFGTGKDLKNTMFRIKQETGYPSYAYAYELSSSIETNDKGTYFVKKASQGRLINPDEIKAVEVWIKELQENSTKYKEDESDVMEEEVIIEAEVVNSESNPKF